MKRKEFYDALYLAHHGIKGQQWGKRNGPPYPLDEEDHSPKEQNQKKGLTDGQKRAIKIGAGLAVAALATYGAYKLHQSGALSDLGLKKSAQVVNINKAREKRETSYYDAVWNETTSTKSQIFRKNLKPSAHIKGTPENPLGLDNNCKECSFATIKRWLGIDDNATAGEMTIDGSVHEFIESQKLNKKGITWIGDQGGITPDSSSSSQEDLVSKHILRRFKDGECGIIGIGWNRKAYEARGMNPADIEDFDDGHAFNWRIENGKVRFVDNQKGLQDASVHLRNNRVALNKEIEICRITRDAFAKETHDK